ncbi:MAG: hypothetical protein JWP88_1759 [Flaviaesturariibacter sp.]|nr:hypothetical protein [Flaviaesturariibacter sp.]
MTGDLTSLSESVVQQPFDKVTIAELEQLTAQYPFFAPAHFLLLKKLDPASEEYRRQYQKAILYYHDPLSFEFFLHRQDYDIPAETFSDTEDEQVATEILEEQAPAEIKIPSLSIPTETASGLTFEPFHTVDYFASQGIKLSQEDASGDKFGKQLKSFTDWLKTMKRLPAVEVAKSVDSSAEKNVENLADHSVQEAEIVTESMAEVWLKQGNKQKAARVYEKLSLLNPSKRAYFAAKIQNLNG